MHKFIIVFICIIQSFASIAQCPSGDVILQNQSEVVDFINTYPNCQSITGNLIFGNEVNDISNFPNIINIQGSLIISGSDITSISNFNNLESIGEDLIIEDTFFLAEIIGFNNLVSIGDDLLIIENMGNNSGLELINGFNSLISISGSLNIHNNLYLNQVIGFDNLNNIDRDFNISNNESLTNISTFDSLLLVGLNFSISFNDSLININGFNLLETIGELQTESGSIHFSIDNNLSLNTITGFENLRLITGNFYIGTFAILNTIYSIPSFNSLEIVGGSFTIEYTSIQNLEFNNLISIGSLAPNSGNFYIGNNNNLSAIDGFNSLVQIYTSFNVLNNSMLENINGLNSLTSVGSNFTLNSNQSLTSLTGLENLISVGNLSSDNDVSLIIKNNSSLIDCSAICNLLSLNGVIGLIQVSDNPSMCSSIQEIILNCTPDFDNDGILDSVDLDDDNDGILDIIEQDGNETRDTDFDGYPDHLDLDSDADGCFDVIESGFTDNDLNGTLGQLPDIVDLDGLIIGEIDGYTSPLDSNSNVVYDFQEAVLFYAGENGSLEICENSIPVDLFNSLNGTPDYNGEWLPSLSSGTGVFDPSIDSAGTYTYSIDNGVCGITSAEVIVSIHASPNAGGSGEVLLCESDNVINLLDYLNGNPDTNGTWSPILSSGNHIFDPSIDLPGVYTYTVSSQACGSISSQLNIIVNNLPNAGENGSLEICENSEPVNLFNNLNGTPELGGEWSPSLSSGTGVFDPSLDSEGTYTYLIDNGICGFSSAEVIVSIDASPNAGESGEVVLCESDNAINLLDYLNGNPDTNGTWSPILSSGNHIFDPSIDLPGVYTYTVSSQACGSISSQLNIVVNNLPNTGENGSLEICENSEPVNLFNSLNGTPELGGEWSPSLSSGTGIFDPNLDSAGAYTYTIYNDGCSSSSTQVNVTINFVEPITDYNFIITELSDNNSIEIIVNSIEEYQFSLDGFNYQNNNIFENLVGGDYTIYIKEINGCGILEERVTILDIPKFFTPNSDGYNDFWGLKGSVEESYYILIYDRYGKLIKTLNAYNSTWDGTYNGNDMPTNDYWYDLTFESGLTRKGHFSLKR